MSYIISYVNNNKSTDVFLLQIQGWWEALTKEEKSHVGALAYVW
jgi:hypothetical protein